MVRSQGYRKKPYERVEHWMDNAIAFPSVPQYQLMDCLVVVDALIEGFRVRRIHVDGGSSSEVMYEHCFRNLSYRTRSRLKESRILLVGFSGEVSYPLEVIDLEVTMRECGKTRTVIMEFAMVKSPSPYNALLGRTEMRSLGAVASTIYSIIKFPTSNGIATIATTRETLRECRQIEEAQVLSRHTRVTDPPPMQTSSEVINPRVSLAPVETRPRRPRKEPMQLDYIEERRLLDKGRKYPNRKPPKYGVEEKIVVNDNYPEQLVTIGGGLSAKCRHALIHTLRKNVDVFAWTPAYMTGIPRAITEHSLDTYPHIKLKAQKKRSLALDRRKVVTDEVNELLKAGIVRRVRYPTWVANPILVKKVDLSKSAERSLPFLDTLKKCTNKKDFRWTEAAGAVFLEMKKLVSELPTLTTPKKGETLMMYLAATNEAVSAVLLTEREGRQMPIHYAIKEVFPSSPDQGAYGIPYVPKVSVKGQVLADFLADTPTKINATPGVTNNPRVEDIQESSNARENLTPGPKAWRICTDGASNNGGSRAGLILIAPDYVEYSYALRFNFSNSNNDAEYEALLTGLRIAKEMQVKDIHAFVDSKLVASQVEGSYEAKGERMIKYREKADALSKLAAVQFDYLSKEVLVEVLNERSVEAVDGRSYLLSGATNSSEANGIIRNPKLELESFCFTFDLVPLSCRKRLYCLVGRKMVGTLGSTPEFSGPAFDAAVQRAVDALLPGLSTRLTNEIRQNGAGGSGDQPPTIHTWLERLSSYKLEGDALNWWKAFKQAKEGETYVATLSWTDFHDIIFLQLVGFVGKKACPPEEQAKHFKWALCDCTLDGIVNTKFTDVANAARNIEILRERSSQNNKRNRDEDRIRPTAQDINQRGYDQKGYDGRSCDRQGGNSNQKSWQNRGQQYNCSSRVTGACFTCGLTGIWQRIALRMVETVVREIGTTINLLLRGEYFLRPRIRQLTLQVPFQELFLFLSTPLDFVLSISTPMGNNVVLSLEFRSCPLRFDDKIRFANLLPLEMSDFDIILGMDWLTEHRATIDCHTKRVIFGDLNNPEFIYQISRPRAMDHPRVTLFRSVQQDVTHKDARELIRACDDCQAHVSVPRLPKADMISVTSAWPFMKWGMDIMGPIMEVQEGFGIPATIITDNGTQFVNDPFKKWAEKLKIQLISTSVYYPQGNGAVERANKSLLRGIKTRLEKGGSAWTEEVPNVLWAHRTMKKTNNGETPFSLTYGTEAVILVEIGMPTHRTSSVNEKTNDQELRLNLDLLDERR
ncbi:reverse transcriptase domain-containing protein [Tanacetum coccineum]